MITEISTVLENIQLQPGVFLLKVKSPQIASEIKPAQFCNIKVSETDFPLLRRPFSVSDVKGDELHFMILIHGKGTELLAAKIPGETLDILGPLGNGFNYQGDYETAVFAAGGIGAAPYPFLAKVIRNEKKIITLSGGRSTENVIKYGMENIVVATDDGSEGFHGNVVELFNSELNNLNKDKIKVFACGPTPMLKALGELCVSENIECELSTESAMACGFGICMGCPVEPTDGDEYRLICKHGPVFNARDIKL